MSTRRIAAAVVAALLTLTTTVIVTFATASSASATPCSRAGCDHTDPYWTGCDTTARKVQAVTKKGYGTFKLMWSSKCNTNWIQVDDFSGAGDILNFRVKDVTRGVTVNCYSTSNGCTSSGKGQHWSNQVYSPANDCTRGYVDYYQGGKTWNVYLASSSC